MTCHFTPEIENVEVYDVTKKYDLMAVINCLIRLICYKEWIKYQTCRVASSFNYLIELKQKMLILLKFVTKNVFFYEFDNETELLMNRSLHIKIKYQTFLCEIFHLMSDQTDHTEVEIVYFINICSENRFFYVAMTTELLI